MSKSREVVKQEEVAVAVLIADSFSVRFDPITNTRPKVMLCINLKEKRCNSFFLLVGSSSTGKQTND